MERKLIEESIHRRIPEELKELTKNFDGRNKDIVLMSSIAVLSNCLPQISGDYNGDEVYPNLYYLLIAPAASGKGAMKFSKMLIEPIDDFLIDQSKNAIKLWKKNQFKNNEMRPQIKAKVLPANISSAELYSYLGNSNHGYLMMESEADTMGNMLKNDWSNYSDILRKAFHHETVSISRKSDNLFEVIKEPKLSILLSGTPEQVLPIVKSRENGLYSRFVVYNFDEVTDFQNVFEKNKIENKIIFKKMGLEVFDMHSILEKRKLPLKFNFTDAQKIKFTQRFKEEQNRIINENAESFIPNLYRHGVICFRIAMILSAIRNKSKLASSDNLICSNDDFMVALNLSQTLLDHSQYTYNSLDSSYVSSQDEVLLEGLNTQFTRQNAIKVGNENDVPKRTMDDKLAQWQKKSLIKRVKPGIYKKL